MIFIIFQIFVKIGQKITIFWQKIGNFLDFTHWFLFRDFRRKVHAFLGKWPNWPNFLYKCSLGYLLQSWVPFFGYLVFWPFYRPRCVVRGHFLVKNGQKRPKKTPLAHNGIHKMAKTPNIKKMGPNFVVGTLRNIYKKIRPIRPFP